MFLLVAAALLQIVALLLLVRPRSVVPSTASDLSSDKFVRSTGACISSLGAILGYFWLELNGFAGNYYVGLGARLLQFYALHDFSQGLSILALAVHIVAQFSSGVLSLLDPASQLKAMNKRFGARNRFKDTTIRVFGIFSIFVSFVAIPGNFIAIILYHLLATCHNGYSAELGVFPTHKKTVNHFIAAALSALAIFYGS
jgi:hypothetical protein